MESPASLGFLAFYLAGSNARHAAPLALLALWQSHYAHRAFVYPLRLGGARPMPASVAAMGAIFNVCNAWMNGTQVSSFGRYPDAWLADPRFLVGAALFAVGWWMNRAERGHLGRRGGWGCRRGCDRAYRRTLQRDQRCWCRRRCAKNANTASATSPPGVPACERAATPATRTPCSACKDPAAPMSASTRSQQLLMNWRGGVLRRRADRRDLLQGTPAGLAWARKPS
ncbi:MAG: hypothetical protein U0325_25700 [Polyangiales bacterium]